jgi:proteasome lid subunit RPN8/RPN11
MTVSREHHARIVAHCLAGMPDEACGLLLGPADRYGVPTGAVTEIHPCANTDASARTYTVDPRDQLRAMRRADELELEIVGVWHSHTHTDAYPSRTDVRQAVDPNWIYALVGFRHGDADLRAYRIADGVIHDLPVDVT